ncbi:MAG: hypothetical protein ACR2JY_11495 [Chloroflexota bacterium]
MLQASPRNQSASTEALPSSSERHVRRWLLLIDHLPSQPSSARSAIWRESKRLGALSLQHGVCLLPNMESSRGAHAQPPLAPEAEEAAGQIDEDDEED